MSYLLDTNAWIALFEDSRFLTERAAELMEGVDGDRFVSVASVWEAAIKVGLGKLLLPYDLEHDLPRLFDDNGFQVLPVDVLDAVAVRALEPVHGDPFDRIQVVQARRRRLTVISRDPVFDRYAVRRVW